LPGILLLEAGIDISYTILRNPIGIRVDEFLKFSPGAPQMQAVKSLTIQIFK